MKTLILEGARPARLLLDGPSLVVSAGQSAPRRFPFARIGRVVVGGRVACEAAALAACLEQGIPITFTAGTGGPAGVALPFEAAAAPAAGLLEDLVSIPGWRGLYADWRRAAERCEILDVLHRWPLEAGDLRPPAVAAVLGAELARRDPDAPVESWRTACRGMLAARIASRLARAGVGRTVPALRATGLHLVADFASILGWRFYRDWRGWIESGAAPRGPRQKPRLAALVEAEAGRDEARIQSLWDRFRYWLAGVA